MEARTRLIRGAIRGLVILLPLVILVGQACAQTPAGANQAAAGTPSQAADGAQEGADAGNIDKLLDMAEKDVGQLSQVHTSGKTGSPSLDMPVSTVARQESTVGQTPSAVFVITNEMIRRSAAKEIPEILRMVPGVDVAKINSNTWAVSIRGFNMRFAGMLLVQIDGRTVYDLSFGGVYWDIQDVLLEDVERIEVIRGPGATIWGANAVNGVINIITKKAQDTQGALLQAGGGSYERSFTNARVGGRMGQDLYYRVYGKWFERGPGEIPNRVATDDWRQARCGFRMDYDASLSDAMTLQGDYYNENRGDMSIAPNPSFPFMSQHNNIVQLSGKNILYRWKHTFDDDSDWTFQTFYDRTEEHYSIDSFLRNRETGDFDFQHRFPLGSRQKIIWGGEYRLTQDVILPAPFIMFYTPDHRFDNLFSFFLQDEITLVEDRWYLTAGSKFEYNDYTNFEYQPTVRLLWTPTKQYSIWGAVSRAVNTPNRSTDDIHIRRPVSPLLPVFSMINGDHGVVSSELLAYEFGIRVQPTERFSWDLALFYNQYDKIKGLVPRGRYIEPPGYLIYPYYFSNTAKGETYGAELALNYQVNEQWRLQGTYTYLQMFLNSRAGSRNIINEGDNPANQVYLLSSWDIGRNWEFDLIGRYVDTLLTAPQPVPSYITMDTRLAWHARQNLEVELVGRNLCRGSFYQFTNDSMVGLIATEVSPEVYGQVTWRY